MKKLFVANWKSNKTRDEAFSWVEEARENLEKSAAEVVICPSFLLIEALVWKLADSTIKVGAQNVSPYPSGAYTGEVSAQLLQGVVSYSIVGHSERKKYFGEDENLVTEKVKKLLEVGITPILCVADQGQLFNYLQASSVFKDNVSKIIFVYEPPSAISGGGDFHPESPQEAAKSIAEFKNKLGEAKVLYGGSVNLEVISSFLQREEIDGFLVGKASLDPQEFSKLVSKS